MISWQKESKKIMVKITVTIAFWMDAKIDVPFKAAESSGGFCMTMFACKEIQYTCLPPTVCSKAIHELKELDLG